MKTPTVSLKDDQTFKISWEAPSNNGGAAITGYNVQIKNNNGVYVDACTGTASDTSCTIPVSTVKASPYSVTPSTSYPVYVYAIVSAQNSAGSGPYSDAGSKQIPGPPIGTTGTPTSTDSGRDQYKERTLTWIDLSSQN